MLGIGLPVTIALSAAVAVWLFPQFSLWEAALLAALASASVNNGAGEWLQFVLLQVGQGPLVGIAFGYCAARTLDYGTEKGWIGPAFQGIGILSLIRMAPIALSLLGTGLKLPSQLFLGWFGPRGLPVGSPLCWKARAWALLPRTPDLCLRPETSPLQTTGSPMMLPPRAPQPPDRPGSRHAVWLSAPSLL